LQERDVAKDKSDKPHKAGKAGKSAKTKIPKQIAGVKIPKSLRDSGKAAIKLSQNPAARELLSAGLMAAATAIAANSRARKAAMDSGQQAKDAMGDAVHSASDSATKIGAALVGAASVAAQRFFKLDEHRSTKDGGDAPASGDAADRTEAPAGDVASGVTATAAVRKPRVKPRVASEDSVGTSQGPNGKF